MPIYTHDMAAQILNLFEDLLSEHDIEIPVPEYEKEERENTEDAACLSGTPYGDLLDATEEIIQNYLRQANVNFIPDVFSGRL